MRGIRRHFALGLAALLAAPALAAPTPSQIAQDPVLGLVGQPAPDFTLTILDGPGKTRTVRKADLAGKVVVIDFWATWCPGCLEELPDYQKLIDSYAKNRPGDVVVVALSEDEGDEPDSTRPLVEQTLAEKKVDLTRGPVGRVALDPVSKVAEAFKVEGLPSVVVLDARGIIRSVHVEYDPKIREILTREVDALLADKP